MRKILVVEDNPSDAKLISYILQKRNYDVQVASDAHNAYEIIGKYPVDMVLLDWQLPSITGLDFLRTLRKESRYQQLPVIFVSSKNALKDVNAALKGGASDYIIKPIDPLILENKMNRLLSQDNDWKLVDLPPEDVNKASLLVKVQIQKLSEVGMEIKTEFQLAPGTIFQIDLKGLSELEIQPIQIKVFSCEKLDSFYISKCSLVGIQEVDLQKIRLYVRMIQIGKKDSNI